MNIAQLWYANEHHIPVLGHRGISMYYPENTLPSFEAAIRAGVDLIEFDVNVTRDGELVVIHDNTIDRTSDHQGRTRDYTLAELKTFDFSYKFPDQFRGVQIPTLREVLSLAVSLSDTLLFNVEIKDMEHETVDQTVAMLHEFGIEERCVIACFDAEIIRYTKLAHPHMRCQGFPGRYMDNFTEDTYDCMFGMGIPIAARDSTDALIAADVAMAREKGILCWLFTADTEENVKKCVSFGCDNITGNDPRVSLDTLRAMGLHK
ncbi:MAG: glycerophosphodiester phosphodiesterase [Clostridiales bacterium]|nr:glycerophosphodiester phosphodiesterase [Clostridiales bacterium]